jgi:Ca2+-binding EF-hand superfamily protein
MKSPPLFVAMLIAFALVSWASAAERAGQDFVCAGDKWPVLIRFHVSIDDKPLLDLWEDFMGKLFAHLDRNGDGVLSKAEALCVPPAQVLFNNAPNFVGLRSKVPETLDKNRDGKITRAELADWYRAIGAAPLQIHVIPVQNLLTDRVLGSANPLLSADILNEKLFRLLDADNDGKLSRDELARAENILHKFDLDEDETISVQELSENLGSNDGRFVSAPVFFPNMPANSGPLTPLESAEANKDHAKHDPDLEFRIRLGRKAEQRAAVELLTIKEKPSPLAKSVRPWSGEKLVLELGATRIELGCAGSLGYPQSELPQLHRKYRTELLRADLDSNGYLDHKEAMQAPLYRNAFRLMDRDGDGKLFAKEVVAYLDMLKELQEATMRSCASLAVRDQGRGLFDLLDGNKDGRLSVRELRQMAKLVDQLDRDGDGRIDRREIPHRYRIDAHPGAASGSLSTTPVQTVRRMNVNDQADNSQRNGPLWFQKMDRNRDGEVSRREFLGSEEAFRKIDQDGDRLISVEEAKRADQMFRKENARKP